MSKKPKAGAERLAAQAVAAWLPGDLPVEALDLGPLGPAPSPEAAEVLLACRAALAGGRPLPALETLPTALAEGIVGAAEAASATSPLAQLRDTSASKAVRRAAAGALHRLELKGTAAARPPAGGLFQRPVLEPLAAVGPFAGDRTYTVFLHMPEAGGEAFEAQVADDGLREIGVLEISRGTFQREILSQPGVCPVSVNHALWLLRRAGERSRQAGRPVPLELQRAQGRLEAHHPPAQELPTPPAGEGYDTPELLYQLFNQPELAVWHPTPSELEPAMMALMSAAESRIVLAGQSEKQKIEEAERRATAAYFAPPRRQLFAELLELVALRCAATGRSALVPHALKAARDLRDRDLEAGDVPFALTWTMGSIAAAFTEMFPETVRDAGKAVPSAAASPLIVPG